MEIEPLGCQAGEGGICASNHAQRKFHWYSERKRYIKVASVLWIAQFRTVPERIVSDIAINHQVVITIRQDSFSVINAPSR